MNLERKFPKITLETLKLYAKASRDDNPIHQDEEVAKSQGLPGVIAHGMLSMAYIADTALLFAKNKGFPKSKIKKIEGRFRAMVFLGDEPLVQTKIKDETQPGQITLEMSLLNGQNQVAITAQVTVTLVG